jgi:hypothetical protein
MMYCMRGRMILGGAVTVGLATALAAWLLVAHALSTPALAATDTYALAAVDTGALALVDRGLAGPAGPDDEGQYRLIDPIGPGGATANSAQDEVFGSTMVGGQYTKWLPYHDPFTSGGTYGHRDSEGQLP